MPSPWDKIASSYIAARDELADLPIFRKPKPPEPPKDYPFLRRAMEKGKQPLGAPETIFPGASAIEGFLKGFGQQVRGAAPRLLRPGGQAEAIQQVRAGTYKSPVPPPKGTAQMLGQTAAGVLGFGEPVESTGSLPEAALLSLPGMPGGVVLGPAAPALTAAGQAARAGLKAAPRIVQAAERIGPFQQALGFAAKGPKGKGLPEGWEIAQAPFVKREGPKIAADAKAQGLTLSEEQIRDMAVQIHQRGVNDAILAGKDVKAHVLAPYPNEKALATAIKQATPGGIKTVSPQTLLPKTVPEVPQIAGIRQLDTASIKVDPDRFQFKLGTNPKTGETTKLAEVKKFEPLLGNQIYAWEDKTGQVFVVNGHQRVGLAKRTGQPTMTALVEREVDGVTEAQARSRGALINIAEGQGTPVDVGKFLRDSGENLDWLRSKGIAPTNRLAARGDALAHLDDGLFNKVVQGQLSEDAGVVIGEGLPKDYANQREVAQLVMGAKKELTPRELKALIQEAKGQTVLVKQATLFGETVEEKSTLIAKAKLRAWIEDELATDKRIFGYVTRGGRPEALARGGTMVDVGQGRELVNQSGTALEVFKARVNTIGPVNDIFRQSAEEVVKGGNPQGIRETALQRIRDAINSGIALKSEGYGSYTVGQVGHPGGMETQTRVTPPAGGLGFERSLGPAGQPGMGIGERPGQGQLMPEFAGAGQAPPLADAGQLVAKQARAAEIARGQGEMPIVPVAAPARAVAPGVPQAAPGAKEPWQMTAQEFKNWEFPVPEGGASKTPKAVLSWSKEDYETLADLARIPDEWRFEEALGKGWEREGPTSLHLKAKIKAGQPITVYRASDVGDIIPGSYVSESLAYTQKHGKRHIPGGKFQIYQLSVYPDELMTYGDPHEFLYIPRTAAKGHERILIKALSEGKPIPPEVLAEYPHLAAQAGKVAPRAVRAEVAPAAPQPVAPAPIEPPPVVAPARAIPEPSALGGPERVAEMGGPPLPSGIPPTPPTVPPPAPPLVPAQPVLTPTGKLWLPEPPRAPADFMAATRKAMGGVFRGKEGAFDIVEEAHQMVLKARDMGEQTVPYVQSYISQIGDVVKAFGVDVQGMATRVGNPEGRSLAINDVLSNYTHYQLTPNQYELAKRSGFVYQEALKLARSYGVKISELGGPDEFWQYIARRVKSKLNPLTGEYETPPPVIGGFKMGAKISAQKERVFEEMAQGVDLGFLYENPAQVMAQHIRGIYRLIGNKQAQDMIQPLTRQITAEAPLKFGERAVAEPALRGRAAAVEIANAIDKIFVVQQAPKALRISAEVSGAMVGQVAALDASALFIQGLPLLGHDLKMGLMGKPSALWLKSWGTFWKSAWNPESMHQFRTNNAELYKRAIEAGVQTGQSEFVSGVSTAQRVLGKVPKIGSTAQEVYRQVYGRAGAAYSDTLEAARIKLFEQLEPVWQREGHNLFELGAVANRMLGTVSAAARGVGPTQRAAERTAAFAPNYLRASLLIMRDLISRGAPAREVKTSLAALLGIGAAVYYTEEKLQGREPLMKPWPQRFGGNGATAFTTEIGGTRVGLGSWMYGMIKALAEVGAMAVDAPDALVRWNDAHPIVKFAKSKRGPAIGLVTELATGRDFFGRKFDSPSDYLLRLVEAVVPIASQSMITQEPKGGVAQVGAELMGLRAFPYSLRSRWTNEGAFKAYEASPSSTREQYRKDHPDVEAQLFIAGKVTTVSTIRAANFTIQYILGNNINPDDIQGVRKGKETKAEWEKAGLRDPSKITPTDRLVEYLESPAFEAQRKGRQPSPTPTPQPTPMPQGGVPLDIQAILDKVDRRANISNDEMIRLKAWRKEQTAPVGAGTR